MINGFSFFYSWSRVPTFGVARYRTHSEIVLNENFHAWEIERVCVLYCNGGRAGVFSIFLRFAIIICQFDMRLFESNELLN